MQRESDTDVAARSLSLAEMRRRHGMSIEQIAAKTKISSRYLKAIEAGRFGDLPGGVYSRSYIRQYAAAIECSADPLLRLCPAEPDELPEISPQNPPVPSWLSRAWAALASPRRLL